MASPTDVDLPPRLKALSQSINRPSVTLAAIVIALVLGAMRLPILEYLRPLGDFYIALLKICVLPFLLSTIPLAVRSAMVGGTAGRTIRSLIVWLLLAVATVATASALVASVIYHYLPADERVVANIGALVGRSVDSIDVEFAIDPNRMPPSTSGPEPGIFSVIPTNIFSALSLNESVRVLVFAIIFGIGMVLTERQTGLSIFGALRHIQAVCIMIFDWFNLLVPIGIIALIAPQIALLGPDAFSILALFAYAFLATGLLLLLTAILVSALSLRAAPASVFAALLKPVMLGASTRNTLVCIPASIEALKDALKVKRELCEIYVPIGFTTVRFGTIVYFVVTALFMGTLMGRSFGPVDLALVAVLATTASFATLGLNGIAALGPLAMVLRPFGLSYEVAVPLMIIIDPIAEIIRVMLNVTVNCTIPVLARGETPVHDPSARGRLGVQIQPVTAGIADRLGLKKVEGAMVDEPQKGSPAAEAGIESGDIVTAVNGTKVKDAREMARTIGMLAPNTKAKLDIIRQGQEKTLTATIGEMSNEHQAKADTEQGTPTSDVPHLGLSLAPANDVAGAGDKGVVVMNVEPDGPAAEQGFQRGNVILDVGGKPVANVGDVRNALKEAKTNGKHTVLMRVRMGDATRFVAVPLGNA